MNNVVCFHSPDEPNCFLSNWFVSNFELDGRHFTSMEQYMMYQKAVTFNDTEIAENIISKCDFVEIKELGRKVRNYNNVVWNGIRQLVVYNGLTAKFSQNDELLRLLLDTGDSVLAECAVNDLIWGIGLSMTDEKRFDMQEWRGQNLLGFTLMMVRNNLR